MIILTEARKRGMRSITRDYVIGMIDWDECVEKLHLHEEAARAETPWIILYALIDYSYATLLVVGAASMWIFIFYFITTGYFLFDPHEFMPFLP